MGLYQTELKKNFSIPLYYQLKELLLKEIKLGKYDENIPLPPETEIATRFNISRPTVRQAICSLVNDGILTRTKGKGTYVIPPEIKEETMHQLNNCNQEISKAGTMPKTNVISIKQIQATPEIAYYLKITENSKVFELIRLRFNKNEPNSIITSYIPVEIYPNLLSRDFSKESLYQVFELSNLFIKRVKRIFKVQLPEPTDLTLLNINENIPLFHFTTIAYSTGNLPVEYSFTKYRGDKNKFSIELRK